MRGSLLWGAVAGILLGGGIGLIAYAVAHGGGTAGVLVIFPFVYGSSPALALGVLGLFGGFVALSLAAAHRAAETEDEAPAPSPHAPTGPLPRSGPGAPPARAPGSPGAPSSSFGGFLLIGPVPVVFGNRPAWFPYLVALALTTVIAMLVFVLLLLY